MIPTAAIDRLARNLVDAAIRDQIGDTDMTPDDAIIELVGELRQEIDVQDIATVLRIASGEATGEATAGASRETPTRASTIGQPSASDVVAIITGTLDRYINTDRPINTAPLARAILADLNSAGWIVVR